MRSLTGIWKIIAGIIAGVWGIFILYTSLTVALHPLLQGGISLSFGLALVFIAYPLTKSVLKDPPPSHSSILRFLVFGTKKSPSVLDIIIIALGIIPCVYIMINWEEIVRNPGVYETHHLVLGAILVLCLLEGTRRSLGVVIPLVVLGFVIYAIVGPSIPGTFGHSGFSVDELLYQFYLMTEGIWGLLTDMTSRIIAPFVIFGPVLFATGVGKVFMDIAQAWGGRMRGGPGHVAVISSSFFGMLSGSSVANVATTGAFTIPTMKKLGFPRELAAGVEASASSGGQIMPPIMGAGCFIMAEFLNIPYTNIMIAGIIPAIIYFVGISAGIWIEAGRYGMGKLPKEMIPSLKEILKARVFFNFIIPIGTLTALLFSFYPPQICAAWSLIVSAITFLIIGGGYSLKEIWQRIKTIWNGYFDGIMSALAWLMVMMSCVQVAVTVISLTGFGVKVSEIIINLSGHNIYLALVAAMLTAIILGMGMTTTAAYVIAAAVLVPAMEGMGLDPLASHMFIFYFAIKSGLTPPVCIAVFTAVAISGGNWLRAAWDSMRLGIGGYIMPFFFVFVPSFLMKGSYDDIIFHFIGAFVAMFTIEAGLMGFFTKPLTWLERIIYFVGGLFLMAPGYYTFIGLGISAVAFLMEKFNFQIPVILKRPQQLVHKYKYTQ
ncbi:MAG: TRAP transporter fused permease subunit [Thermodesulfovibrionales bacterium]|nr:TRAP transporter fused permease subunit [Thermodesulfovibrionales bacterium]